LAIGLWFFKELNFKIIASISIIRNIPNCVFNTEHAFVLLKNILYTKFLKKS